MRATALVPAKLSVFFRQVGIVVRLRSFRRRQRSKIGAEIADILVADLLDDRLHLLVLAGAGAKENQLPLNELIGLAGKRRNVLGLRNAGFAVTGGAELGFLLAGRDIGGLGR
jgi:hypothetical protein